MRSLPWPVASGAFSAMALSFALTPAVPVAWAQAEAPKPAVKEPPAKTAKAAAKPAPKPKPAPPKKLGPRGLYNRKEVADLWARSLKGRRNPEEWTVSEHVVLHLSDIGDAVSPAFSPDGAYLAFQLNKPARGGNHPKFLRITSLKRLRNSNVAFLDVRSPSGRRRAVLLTRHSPSVSRAQYDKQVFFFWSDKDRFTYYSLAQEKVCRGQIPPGADTVNAEKLVAKDVATLDSCSGVTCFDDKRGIYGLGRSSRQPKLLVDDSGVTRDQTAAVIDGATMPAVCPAKPGVIAFIGRVRRSSSPDLCVRFDENTVHRVVTPKGWEKLPRWSPDGKAVAFYSTRTNLTRGEHGIWGVRVNLKEKTVSPMFPISGDDQLSYQDLRDSRKTGGPAWTPDSQQVVYFAKKRGPGKTERYYMRSYDMKYGKEEGPLTVALPKGLELNAPGDVACSPAGGLVAFSHEFTSRAKREFRIVLLLTDMPGASAGK